MKNPTNKTLIEAHTSKKILFLMLCMSLFILIPSVSAWSSNNFNNSLTSENVTLFYSNETEIRYIAIPDNINYVMNASFNISSLDGYSYQETQDAYNCSGGWSALNPCINALDGSWATYANGQGVGVLGLNYTLNNNAVQESYWMSRDGVGYNYNTVPEICWNRAREYGVLELYIFSLSVGVEVQYFCRDSEVGTTVIDTTSATRSIYEEALNWSYGNLTSPNVYLGDSLVWNYTGLYDDNENTDNLNDYINTYLSTCSYVNGFCNVPFLFNSTTSGNFIYNNLYFDNFGIIQNSQEFNNKTIELLLTEEFNVNITYDSGEYAIDTANLKYNNTYYTGIISGSGNTIVIESSLTPPELYEDTNISFHWEIALNNGTDNEYYNLSSETQLVKNISIDDCSTNTIELLNYTLYDEDSLGLVDSLNTSIDVEVLVGNYDLSSYSDYAINTTGKIEVLICSNENITGSRLDAQAKYYSQDRVVEYHNIQNYTVNHDELPREISLYDLKISNSQEFLITFKNSHYVPVENALIEITRQYIGEGGFKTVEIPKTDADGNAIAHLVLGDEIYTIKVWKNGRLLATYKNVVAFCENILTGDCTIELIEPLSTEDFDNPQAYKNVSIAGSYEESTRTYTVSFKSIDGVNKEINLTVYSFDATETALCSSKTTSTSGSLTCVIPESIGNITAIAKVFVNSQQVAQDIFKLRTSLRDEFGTTRYLLAFILVLTLPLLAFTNGVFVLILFLVGLAIASMLYLIDIGGLVGMTSVFIWFVVAVGILLWKIRRGD